jgi:hypothetical protein
MPTSRYTYVQRINGERVATTDITSRIYFACNDRLIDFNEYPLKERQRLDHIAAQAYGDGTLWWIVASASGVGWSLQCPAGTILRVPLNLNQIYDLLR